MICMKSCIAYYPIQILGLHVRRLMKNNNNASINF
ncbi:hypothetical protein [Acinetobacter phage Ab69]|nr:hypothetical protein [Acinetobacter phage Ab69]